MNTYFARHSGSLDINDSALERLKQSKQIAIHYPWIKGSQDDDPDTESLNPNDYEPKGKSAIGAMMDVSRDGGYVCATYRHSKTAIVGRVRPGTKIELAHERWGSDPARTAVLKTLALHDVIEVPASKHGLLLSMAPQQSTFSRWHRVGDKIERLVQGIPWSKELGSLHTTYQEVMCSEFLRTHKRNDLPRLRHLMLPVGRTMKGIDILGVAVDGKPILAQVTFGRSASKLTDLGVFSDNGDNYLIYFCDAEEVRREGSVIVVPIQVAFDEFASTTAGRQWLEAVHSLL